MAQNALLIFTTTFTSCIGSSYTVFSGHESALSKKLDDIITVRVFLKLFVSL
jgi:hypothetical protein